MEARMKTPMKALMKTRTNQTSPAKIIAMLWATLITTLGFTTLSVASPLTPLWTLSNFDQPESVVSDISGQHLYVSNINGQPTQLNGKGYISKLSVDGKVIEQHWLQGLDAPKGMAIAGDTLYVADMQQVHVVSLAQGRIVNRFVAPKAKMLNDITIGNDGTAYISDLLGGGIYRLKRGIKKSEMTLWFTHKQLAHPNGLLWQGNDLLVASWGLGMNPDFTTNTPGSIFKINASDNKPSLTLMPAATEMGNLDGLASFKNSLYVSDWISGALFKVQGNQHSQVLKLNPGLADISAHGNMLFAPLMMDGVVRAWRI